jgi:hypothetical protein
MCMKTSVNENTSTNITAKRFRALAGSYSLRRMMRRMDLRLETSSQHFVECAYM